MSKEQFTGLLRHALTVAGTWAVARGYLDAGTTEQVVGVVVVLAAAGWSISAKRE